MLLDAPTWKSCVGRAHTLRSVKLQPCFGVWDPYGSPTRACVVLSYPGLFFLCVPASWLVFLFAALLCFLPVPLQCFVPTVLWLQSPILHPTM